MTSPVSNPGHLFQSAEQISETNPSKRNDSIEVQPTTTCLQKEVDNLKERVAVLDQLECAFSQGGDEDVRDLATRVNDAVDQVKTDLVLEKACGDELKEQVDNLTTNLAKATERSAAAVARSERLEEQLKRAENDAELIQQIGALQAMQQADGYALIDKVRSIAIRANGSTMALEALTIDHDQLKNQLVRLEQQLPQLDGENKSVYERVLGLKEELRDERTFFRGVSRAMTEMWNGGVSALKLIFVSIPTYIGDTLRYLGGMFTR